jgi:hypothetical protein
MVPPGYTAELLATADNPDTLGSSISQVEEPLPEGTLMLTRIDFNWRFPLFEQIAGLYDWELKREGVQPWPGYGMIVFCHETEPIWYVCWRKGFAWGAVIAAVLISFFASWVGQALAAVFLGALVYRLLPPEITKPIEDFLKNLSPLLVIAAMGFLVMVLPGLAKRVTEK